MTWRVQTAYTDGTTGWHPTPYATKQTARRAAKRLLTTSGITRAVAIDDDRYVGAWVGSSITNYDVAFGLAFLKVNNPAAAERAKHIVMHGTEAARATLRCTLAADSPFVLDGASVELG